jgi:hypothetical protein
MSRYTKRMHSTKTQAWQLSLGYHHGHRTLGVTLFGASRGVTDPYNPRRLPGPVGLQMPRDRLETLWLVRCVKQNQYQL